MIHTEKGKLMVAAHRGDSHNYPENTLPAFRSAIACGADMIETDVYLSKDGELVLMHDIDVDRTTNGTGKITEKTLAELRALNTGYGAEGYTVPTLEELVQLMKGTGVTLNLEMKEYFSLENKERCHVCVDKAVALFKKYDFEDMVIFNSFDAYVLEYVAEHYPQYPIHGFYPYTAMRNVRRNPDEYLFCACLVRDWHKEDFDYLLERGIEPWLGSMGTQSLHLEEYVRRGGRLITLNYPADCLEKLRKLGLHD